MVALLILLGFGFSLFSSPNTNAVMGSIDKRFYGVASGVLSTMRSMGMMLRHGVCDGDFFDLYGENSNHPRSLSPLSKKCESNIHPLHSPLRISDNGFPGQRSIQRVIPDLRPIRLRNHAGRGTGAQEDQDSSEDLLRKNLLSHQEVVKQDRP